MNENQDSEGYASPTGWSASESSTGTFVETLGSDHPTLLTKLTVAVSNAPGVGATRSFSLVINGAKAPACAIAGSAQACSRAMSITIPKDALLYLECDVTGADAVGADAAVSWMTSG